MQVVVIHGGEAFDTYEDYVAWLTAQEVMLEPVEYKGWKRTLQEELGDGFEVILPRMPSPQNAKYSEWKLWFEKYIPLLEEGAVFVGHSLGGTFLAKYFSEEKYPKNARALFLVAAPYGVAKEYQMADFLFTNDLSPLWEQCGNVFLYHSTDDPVVPLSCLEQFKRQLPFARASIFGNRGHFTTEAFPEIVTEIRALGEN